MAIARTGTSKGTAASGTTASVTRPSGAATGDLLILAIATEDGSTITAPGGAGWVEVFSINSPVNVRSYALFTRVDDGAAGPWTFSWDGGNDFRWWRCIAYSGVDVTADGGVTDSGLDAVGHSENASSANILAPAITPSVDNCFLLFIGNPDGATSSMSTDPPSMTEFDATANCVYAAEQQLGAGTGGVSTGTKTGVMNAATENQGILIALRPSGGDTTITATQATVAVAGQSATVDDTGLTITATQATVAVAGQSATVEADPPAPPQSDPTFAAFPAPPPEPRLRVVLAGVDVTPLVEAGLSFSNVSEGGYESCSFTFPGDLAISAGDPIVIEYGMKRTWLGRVAEVGLVQDRTQRRSIAGEGAGAALKETSISQIWIDSDMSRWQGASRARQLAVLASNFQPNGPSVEQDPDNGVPALRLQVEGSWVSPVIPISEALYDAGYGNKIRGIWTDWRSTQAGGSWVGAVGFTDVDSLAVVEGGSNLYGGATDPAGGYLAPTIAARRYAYMQRYYNATPAGADGQDFSSYVSAVTVYGDPLLKGYGSDPVGYRVADIVRDLASRAENIGIGSIRDVSDFIVRQFTAYTPEPLQDLIARAAAFERAAWGTWAPDSIADDVPRFDFGPYPDEPNTWALTDGIVGLDLTSRLDSMYDEAKIIYQDAADGDGVVTVTQSIPELLARVPGGRTVTVNMGLGTAATASAFGAFFLALANRNARASGSITIRGEVGSTAGSRPAAELEAGKDAIRIDGLDDDLAFGRDDFQISRVEVSNDAAGPVTKLEIGGGPDLLEVFTARLEAATTLASAA